MNRDALPRDPLPSDRLPRMFSHRSPGGLDKALWSITYPTLLRVFPANATVSAANYIQPVVTTARGETDL